MELPAGGLYLSCAASRLNWGPLLDDDRIFPFLGIHPEKIMKNWREDLEVLDLLLRKNSRAGIGECGLDRRFYKESPRALQEEILDVHFRLAAGHGRPVALHQVRAAGALAEYLEARRPDVPVMIHGFAGSMETLRRYVSQGLYISLGPDFPWDSGEASELIAAIPEDKLLLETDWPFPASPGGYEKQLSRIYDLASARLGIDKESLAGLCKRNGSLFTH